MSTSRLVQSRSLPGSPPPESAPLRSRTISRALRALSRASAASMAFCTMILAILGFSSRYLFRKSPTAELTIPSTSLLPSLVLVWPSNCGSGTRSEITAVSPSRKSSPVTAEVLEQVFLLAVGVQAARQRGAEARDVRAAFDRVDVVDVRVDVLGVLAGVLHGDFEAHAVVLAGDVDHVGVDRLAGAVEVLDELEDAALVLERVAVAGPLVAEDDLARRD